MDREGSQIEDLLVAIIVLHQVNLIRLFWLPELLSGRNEFFKRRVMHMCLGAQCGPNGVQKL